MAGTSFGI